MANPTPTIKPPTLQEVDLILRQARLAPLQNMEQAEAVDKAWGSVRDFFRQLYAPPVSQEKTDAT